MAPTGITLAASAASPFPRLHFQVFPLIGTAMTSRPVELYFPCLKDHKTGELTIKVGEAMSFPDAVAYLKQHHSGAWSSVNASPQPVGAPALADKA